MNKTFKIILILVLFLSCEIKNIEYFKIYEFNNFQSYKENILLGQDIISYDYISLMTHESIYLNTSEIDAIKWRLEIDSVKNEILFLLRIDDEVKEKKMVIKDKFQAIVNNTVKKPAIIVRISSKFCVSCL